MVSDETEHIYHGTPVPCGVGFESGRWRSWALSTL